MPFVRIGERLVQAGVIDTSTLEKALEAQVIYGARLCTNIIEIAHLNLDVVAVELAKQHALPPALSRHFAIADVALQRELSPEVVGRMCAVPLGLLPGERVAVAVRDPLAQVELDELKAVYGREIAQAVAPELRIFYYIERAYGLRRDNRFLRVRRGGTLELPLSAVHALAPSSGPAPATAPPPSKRAPTHLDTDELQLDDGDDDDFHIDVSDFDSDFDGLEQTGAQLADSGTDPTGERRRFVHALNEPGASAEDQPALGRIALRRVSHGSRGELPVLSFEDTLKAIRRATGRDAVGDLVVAALRDHIEPSLAAAAVFVCRGSLAIGWRGFVRDGDDDLIDDLAVPLDTASIVQQVALSGHPHTGEPRTAALDERMWALLGLAPAQWVGCAPVEVSNRTVAVVYAHALGPMPASAAARVVELGERAGQAFERLIRAAER